MAFRPLQPGRVTSPSTKHNKTGITPGLETPLQFIAACLKTVLSTYRPINSICHHDLLVRLEVRLSLKPTTEMQPTSSTNAV